MKNVPTTPWLVNKPVQLFLVVLAIVCLLELLVMLLVVPRLSAWLESRPEIAALDSVLLTVALVPFLWRLIVVPLKQVADLRQSLIDWSLTQQEIHEARIASNLHDGIGQMVTGLTMGLRAIEDLIADQQIAQKVAALRGVGMQIHESLRHLARELRPPVLDAMGLLEALASLANQIQQDHQVQITLNATGLEAFRLARPIETALFRIVQESIANAVRHGGAKHVRLGLEVKPNGADLVVEDDGRGFDLAEVYKRSGSQKPFGLHSMHERASIIGGRFDIQSAPGKGTVVRVHIPSSDNFLVATRGVR